ncbi:MAG: site-specific recombinase [Chitinophagaceae bacterium]|nr:site-specific recombinase [Chitinophagaceae bacterium]
MKFRFLSKKKADNDVPEKGRAVVLSIKSSNRGLEFLVELFQQIRPSNPKNIADAETKFKALLYQLQEDRSLLFALRRSLLNQFIKSDIKLALTESGLLSARGFIQELGSKLKHKILPPLLKPTDFLYVIERVFYKQDDYLWMEKMDEQLWIRLFELIGIEVNLTEPVLIKQLSDSLQILSYRLSMMGLEKEVTARYDQLNDGAFPFMEQNRLINLLLERKQKSLLPREEKLLLENIAEALHNCLQSIKWLKDNRKENGTSLAETFLLTRMEQHVERMFMIVDALDEDNLFNTQRFIHYFITVVRNQNRKNSIGEFLSQNLGLLAYQISEHGGKRGESYIATTRKEFYKLFRSAMGGGFIISFIAIFKNLLGKLAVGPFLHGLLYSANYSMGFILIQSSNSTLATKQPAFTASAIAASLDSSKFSGRPDLYNLALTIARTARSQIASFAGNLIIVFPLTYLLAMLFHLATGSKIAAGAEADVLLRAQHPFASLALVYACVTGFFLFLSGLVAGWVENYVVYAQLPDRLRFHPVLTQTLGKRQLKYLVNLVQNNMGSIAGSISLGFFLGMAGFIGKTFTIPFDIRHITISAGNTAIAFYGLDHQVQLSYLLTIVLGVFLIGFFNFLVSFGLAFYVAVKSRGIRLKDYPEFLGILWRYFRKYPSHFIRPSSRFMNSEELEQKLRKQVGAVD